MKLHAFDGILKQVVGQRIKHVRYADAGYFVIELDDRRYRAMDQRRS